MFRWSPLVVLQMSPDFVVNLPTFDLPLKDGRIDSRSEETTQEYTQALIGPFLLCHPDVNLPLNRSAMLLCSL
jgi:hypothetical protein